jgi:hypothetical protein
MTPDNYMSHWVTNSIKHYFTNTPNGENKRMRGVNQKDAENRDILGTFLIIEKKLMRKIERKIYYWYGSRDKVLDGFCF